MRDLVVDDGVDGHSDAVLGQDLLGWYVEGDGPQVADCHRVHAGGNEEQAGTHRPSPLNATEPKDDCSLVFLIKHYYYLCNVFLPFNHYC
jgi:hypothetical protein